jgi:hypothetical protein
MRALLLLQVLISMIHNHLIDQVRGESLLPQVHLTFHAALPCTPAVLRNQSTCMVCVGAADIPKLLLLQSSAHLRPEAAGTLASCAHRVLLALHHCCAGYDVCLLSFAAAVILLLLLLLLLCSCGSCTHRRVVLAAHRPQGDACGAAALPGEEHKPVHEGAAWLSLCTYEKDVGHRLACAAGMHVLVLPLLEKNTRLFVMVGLHGFLCMLLMWDMFACAQFHQCMWSCFTARERSPASACGSCAGYPGCICHVLSACGGECIH